MLLTRQNCTKTISILVAITLLATQAGVIAHAFEHDPAKSQISVCSTCIASHAVSAACVASTPRFEIPVYKLFVGFDQVSKLISVDALLARQRAPPTPLQEIPAPSGDAEFR
jgi:hypothetical protein